MHTSAAVWTLNFSSVVCDRIFGLDRHLANGYINMVIVLFK